MKTIKIGIETGQAQQMVEQLNRLLANVQLFYMNTRGLHWNITGEKFFELHLKFEELYNDLNLKADEIAERILTLEGTPAHNFTDYKAKAEIHELKDVNDATKGVKSIIDSLGVLIRLERQLLSVAQNANDEGTSALISDYIREQEKLVWMYSAYLRT